MNLSSLTETELKEALMLKEKLDNYAIQDQCQESFINYVEHIWPEFICGRHHKVFAQKLQDVVDGKCKRLIVNMPPRHTKSEFASTFFPSYIMGLKPKMKIMQTTHTGELAVRFGRKVRNLMDQEEYKKIFPEVKLQADNKSAGRWETNKGGS
jgi:hypothetical protein